MNNRFRALVESFIYCLCFSTVWIAVAPLAEGVAVTASVDSVPAAQLNTDMLFTKKIALGDTSRMS